MKVTQEQAQRALSLIIQIVDEVYPEGERPMATEIRLDPATGEDMRKLVEEMRANEKE